MTQPQYILSTVCTGIGSPEQACEEIGIPHEIGFYCEINKYARASYEAMFKAGFMVEDMTKEDWDSPEFYSDIIVGGIPCQSFSLAGLRKGELDPRGLLFYDYYRYVKKQKPKAFIIENVKGLLSDSAGKTFQNWLHLMGQSVNGHHQMFNSPDSLPYNLHWTVLNTKDFSIPQNRERVFLVGIRDDLPNNFRFPVGEPLKLRLKDILEPVVDEKYYLSDKALEYLTRDSTGKWSDRLSMLNYDTADTAGCVTANHSKGVPYNMLQETVGINLKLAGMLDTKGNESIRRIYDPAGLSPTVTSNTGGGHEPKIIVKEATKQGYAIANEGDSINLSNPNSETRRGRVGVANILDTACNQAVVVANNGPEPNVLTPKRTEFGKQIRKDYEAGNVELKRAQIQTLKPKTDGIANTLTSVQKDNLVSTSHRIRRLTPLECWRLQGFPDEQFYKAQKVNSDSQLYRQAGNSMTTNVIKAVIEKIIPIITK